MSRAARCYLPLGLGAAASLLYLATAATTVSFGGDCGELAAAAWCLGIAHPTGYPLYLLLAKLFTLLPVGEVAFRLTILSALCGGATVGLLCRLVVDQTDDPAAGILAGAALAVSFALWSQAVIAEVYTLETALIAGLLVTLAAWRRDGGIRRLRLAGVLLGLGLAHHLLTLLALPAVALLLRGATPEQPGHRRPWLVVVGWALPWLALYAYLPLRAAADPPLAWAQLDGLGDVLGHITGRAYRGNLLELEPGTLGRIALVHLRWLAYDLRWAAAFALAGLVLARRQPLYAPLLGLALLSFAFGVVYRVGDRTNYLLPAYLSACALVGLGAAELRRRWPGGAARQFAWSALLVLLPLLPAPPDGSAAARAGYDRASMRGNDRAARLAQAVLAEAPPEALLFSLSDELTYSLWYLQIVEGLRGDLSIEAVARLETDEQRALVERGMEQATPGRPVCLAFDDQALLAGRRYAVGRATVRLLDDQTPVSVSLTRRQEPGRELPGCGTWRLVEATADSPVAVETLLAGEWLRLPAVKAQTTARLRAVWRREPGDEAEWEVLLAGFHETLAGQLEAGATVRGPAVLNEATGAAAVFWTRRLPFAPTADRFEVEPGLTVADAYPLAVPDWYATGAQRIRLGLVRRGAAVADEPAAAWAATVPAAVIGTYRR